MAVPFMLTTFLEQYVYTTPKLAKQADAIRLGIISAAAINTPALYLPAQSHPGVKLVGIASRDVKKAEQHAKKWNIEKVFQTYDELLADPEIDAVYIGLPNVLHAEWAIKSLRAGKHVLLEKPFASNTAETRKVFEVAHETNKILLEAFHWQFHPAAHVVKSLIASGKYGALIRTYSTMSAPSGMIGKDDIRWKYDLAGGATMDMTYTISTTRYFVGADDKTLLPTGIKPEVLDAVAVPWKDDSRVDASMTADFRFDLGDGKIVESKILNDMDQKRLGSVIPKLWDVPSIEIELEKATIYFYNYILPHVYHYIAIYDKETKHTTYQKHYSYGPKWGVQGEASWTTYRYQLEAFIDKLQGREPKHWITEEDSIAQMETIDAVYEKSGLGIRPSVGWMAQQ